MMELLLHSCAAHAGVKKDLLASASQLCAMEKAATFVGTIKECGHKFCVRCVTTHVHKTMVNGHVLCPLCRTAADLSLLLSVLQTPRADSKPA